MRKDHRLLLLALVLAAAHQAVFITWTSDDSFISYRYAENWASGKGLVFNTGERVEGFSNFLWVAVLAFFRLLGISGLVASKLISFAASQILIILMFKKASAGDGRRFAAAAPALSLAFSASLAYFSMAGLESVFYTCLLFLAVVLNGQYEQKPAPGSFYALCAVLLAVSLTRPEGIMFFGLSAAYHFIKKIAFKKGIRLKSMLAGWAGAAAVMAIFFFLRVQNYSEILPNTFFAKPRGTFAEGTGSPLFSNFGGAFFTGSFLMLVLVAAVAVPSFLKKHPYPLLIVAGQIFFMSYAGDWMALGRFFFPVLPIVLDLCFELLRPRENFKPNTAAARVLKLLPSALFVIFAAFNLAQTSAALKNADVYPYLVMESSRLAEIGKYLKREFPAGTLIATRRQGAIPYYSGMNSVDLLGLTDRTVARNIYHAAEIANPDGLNADYILGRRPGVIILFSSTSRNDGLPYDKSRPRDRLLSFELLIYMRAIESGYSLRETLPVGKDEKALFLSLNPSQPSSF